MKTKSIALILSMALCAVFCRAQGAADAMQKVQNEKTGILLVHYGTGNDQSRAATIDKLNVMVADRFAGCKVLEAYAAPTVIKALAKRGIRKLTIAEALDSLRTLGCIRLAVQSTMLLDGVMTDMLERDVNRAKGAFRSVKVGRPLLYSVDDCRTLTDMIYGNLAADKRFDVSNSQVVLVGHGSDSPANAMYSQIDYLLKDEGRTLWHVGTIEGYPTVETVERQLAKSKVKSVILVPLLYIAGNHQKEDIDGVWTQELKAKGYSVSSLGKGLGEMPQVQQMILDRVAVLVGEGK